LRVLSLHACLQDAPWIVTCGETAAGWLRPWSKHDEQEPTYVDRDVFDQIALVAIKGLEEAENQLLLAIDKVLDQRKIDRDTSVPLALCLWRLIIMYRGFVYRYTIREKGFENF
jgi:hypothetical protein